MVEITFGDRVVITHSKAQIFSNISKTGGYLSLIFAVWKTVGLLLSMKYMNRQARMV